ncbi:MAG: sortase [Chloroflexi bacterium]|nr:MAG: sortase [Chloroflexota bacterium]MBL1194619.1 sortase [Chloroflexota bacterium]NOH11909.1 sortase [Chloroflexota bacterium]
MANKRPDQLNERELQALLKRKRIEARNQRLEEFARSGRIITLAPDLQSGAFEDFDNAIVSQPVSDTPSSRRKRISDRILLGVEILAVVGLIFILFNGVNLIRTLNSEVVAAFDLPTPSPTPLISAVVLPSGHTPPTDPGGARPNDAEIPEHLRPIVQALNNVPVPTPSPEHPIRIQIPAIGVDAPIVQGDNWESLKQGVGQHIGSANPGQQGNVVLSGHNDIFGEIFRYLDQLEPGDEIVIFSNVRAYNYVITDWEIVEPTAVHVMDPTEDPTTTLISCYPYLINTERIVVKALLNDF